MFLTAIRNLSPSLCYELLWQSSDVVWLISTATSNVSNTHIPGSSSESMHIPSGQDSRFQTYIIENIAVSLLCNVSNNLPYRYDHFWKCVYQNSNTIELAKTPDSRFTVDSNIFIHLIRQLPHYRKKSGNIISCGYFKFSHLAKSCIGDCDNDSYRTGS